VAGLRAWRVVKEDLQQRFIRLWRIAGAAVYPTMRFGRLKEKMKGGTP